MDVRVVHAPKAGRDLRLVLLLGEPFQECLLALDLGAKVAVGRGVDVELEHFAFLLLERVAHLVLTAEGRNDLHPCGVASFGIGVLHGVLACLTKLVQLGAEPHHLGVVRLEDRLLLAVLALDA